MSSLCFIVTSVVVFVVCFCASVTRAASLSSYTPSFVVDAPEERREAAAAATEPRGSAMDLLPAWTDGGGGNQLQQQQLGAAPTPQLVGTITIAEVPILPNESAAIPAPIEKTDETAMRSEALAEVAAAALLENATNAAAAAASDAEAAELQAQLAAAAPTETASASARGDAVNEAAAAIVRQAALEKVRKAIEGVQRRLEQNKADARERAEKTRERLEQLKIETESMPKLTSTERAQKIREKNELLVKRKRQELVEETALRKAKRDDEEQRHSPLKYYCRTTASGEKICTNKK